MKIRKDELSEAVIRKAFNEAVYFLGRYYYYLDAFDRELIYLSQVNKNILCYSMFDQDYVVEIMD